MDIFVVVGNITTVTTVTTTSVCVTVYHVQQFQRILRGFNLTLERARLATTPPSDDTENTRLSSVSPHTTPHAPSSVVTRAPGDARNTAAGVETHRARVPSRSERHRAVERADGFQKK